MTSRGPDSLQPRAVAAGQGQATNTADFLTGDWKVTRRIHDHSTGQVGSFQGSARFRQCAESDPKHTLAYVERGELRFAGHHGPAERSLMIQDAGDGTADVRFADGREFYRLDLRTGRCEASHPCRADIYQVTVTMLSADSYTETWRVTGPSKDYELQTTYTRAPGTGPDSVAESGDPR